LGGSNRLDWMLWQLCSGGLMLGAIFMATDYTTSPVNPRAQVVYGIGCGAFTVFIRYFGAYVEGVSYAILLMNTCVWLLDRTFHGGRFGAAKQKLKPAAVPAAPAGPALSAAPAPSPKEAKSDE
jgi:electron transport complex protein RnfD